MENQQSCVEHLLGVNLAAETHLSKAASDLKATRDNLISLQRLCEERHEISIKHFEQRAIIAEEQVF